MLLLGVGSVTRLLRFLTALGKSYDGEVVLGVETDSLDASGRVTATHDMSAVTVEQVRAASLALTGEIDQVPPMVSAVSIGGRRLHELAREGIEIDRPARRVVVHRFTVGEPIAPSVFPISVDCSSGTYIRSLAADLGRLLGGGGHLRNLRRTAVGSFTVAEALPLDQLRAESLLTAAQAMRDYRRVVVDAETAVAVGHGRVLDRMDRFDAGDGPWAVLDASGELLAMFEADGAQARPAVVLHR